ncbi:MAG: 3-deoxy-D-manno-octulosonic acid transferase [Thermodesulfobacteriota bacterium]
MARFAAFLYNLAWFVLAPLWIAVGLALVALSEKRRKTFFPRLGFQHIPQAATPADRPVWLHALSVGEVRSAAPLLSALKEKRPDLPLLVTSSTATGFETAQKLYGGSAALALFPYDFPPSVQSIAGRINPRLLIIVETDLWPNVTKVCSDRRVPIALVNGRMSAGSCESYRKMAPFTAPVFGRLDLATVPSQEQADRYRGLGVSPERIFITGNIKFDAPTPSPSSAKLRTGLSIPENAPVIVCGSTHPGEEEIIAEAFLRLQKSFPGLVLVLAPRDPKRSRQAAALFQARGCDTCLWSDREKRGAAKVWLVDEMGVLDGLYALSDAVFMGGSLVPEGGHNLLEPAARAKPVLFGPHTEDFAEIADLLVERNAALRINGAEDLARLLGEILGDPGRARLMGDNAARAVAENRGAVDKTLELLQPFLH